MAFEDDPVEPDEPLSIKSAGSMYLAASNNVASSCSFLTLMITGLSTPIRIESISKNAVISREH